MRVVFRTPGAIVATFAILAGCALSGCGQRGSLYLPNVPPLPAKPNVQTQAPSPNQTTPANPGDDTAEGSIPDTSGTALSLSPDTELKTAPNSNAPAQAASGVPQAQ